MLVQLLRRQDGRVPHLPAAGGDVDEAPLNVTDDRDDRRGVRHLVQELRVLDMVRLLVAVELHIVRYHLFVGDVFEHQKV